jgi:hypothetical protein
MTPSSAAGSSIVHPQAEGIRWIRRASVFLGVIFLTLWSFRPADTVLAASLDVSNYGSYAYFTAHHFRYGNDAVAMAGPYGFIPYGFVYGGELFWSRLLLELLVKGAFSTLIFWFFLQSSARGWRWLWLITAFVAAPLIEDTPYDLCILLSGLYLLLHFERPGRLAPPYLVAVLLALLSLCKGTQVAFVVPTLGLVAFAAVMAGQKIRGAKIIGAYFLAGVVLWLAAGQHLKDIPGFLRGVQELASGYNFAMGLDEPWVTTRYGLVVFGALLASAATSAWLCRRHLPRLLACLFVAGFTFTQWKHGFVRADGHIFIFFIYAGVAALMPLLLCPPPTAGTDRGARWLNFCVAALTVVIGVTSAGYGGSANVWLGKLRHEFPHKLTHLLHPFQARKDLEAGLTYHRKKFALPALRAAIGTGTVDLFGSDHGFIPLNDLRYHPRPVGGGSFNVYTEYLKQLNEAFVLDPGRRPDFYLLKPQILDNRFLSQDDSRCLLPILYLYRPEATERSLVLLARKKEASPPPAPVLLKREAFRWGQSIGVPSLPSGSSDLILASFEIEPSLRGRLRAFFYKPSEIYLSLSGTSIVHRESLRLIPNMVRSPILFSPVMEDALDMLGLYTADPGKVLQDFRLTSNHPELYRTDGLHVSFYRLPRPPADPDAGHIRDLLRFPIGNLGAESIEPAAFPHYMDDGYVVGFHAPSRAVFPLDGTEREITMTFGLEPTAYTGNGDTDGVTFIFEITQPGLAPQPVFRRHLDPRKSASDRGAQTEQVVLPTFSVGSKLTVRSDPGPVGDGAWDWAYISRFDVKKGAYLAAQFPGFSRPPQKVEGEYTGVFNPNEHPVFMLNAPGRLTFNLSQHESSIVFAGGIMPGAYTGEGHSDGAAYVVEMISSDGTKQTLFHRMLNPRDVAGDRGPHSFSVAVPSHPDGTLVTISTDAGPAGDRSWDWTYVSDVIIK